MNRVSKALTTVPKELFVTLEGWGDLSASEQTKVIDETQALGDELMQEGWSKLAQGRHLSELRKVLEPKQMFVNFLNNIPRINIRSAYRYMNAWESAEKVLPEPALRVLLSRGINIIGAKADEPFGAYTEPLKALPPPKTGDREKYGEWADKLEEAKKRQRNRRRRGEDGTNNITELLKEAFMFTRRNFRRLPRNHKSRMRWMTELVGMMMTELGVSNAQSFSPVAVPEDFRRGPGRPAKEVVAD